MLRPSSRAAALAALFTAVQLAAACGGGDDDTSAAVTGSAPVAAPSPAASPAEAPAAAPTPASAPTTISPLKTLLYSVQHPADSSIDFSGAGAVSDPTTEGATLSLGAAGSIVLTVDRSGGGFAISTPGHTVVSRFAGSLLMLCDDATATPGDGTGRLVAVAQSVAEGGIAAEAVTDATALAGLRFYKLANCSYQSAQGPQGQHSAADGDTLHLAFDAEGNATSNAFAPGFSAAQFSAVLTDGTAIGGMRFTAWRFIVDGQVQYALVERMEADATLGLPSMVQLWLPQ
jgi:hypothetical protein